MPTSPTAVRIARPTGALEPVRSFYEDTVGFTVLWSFTDHDGFDGVIFGLPGEAVQLEIVRSPHGDVPAPTNEDALVLYFDDDGQRTELLDRLRQAGVVEVAPDDPSLNPYWPRAGARTFVDPDGYRLIVVPTDPQR
jgi:Glyoxalase/Bleomycin resistance protein/Dioxygenase superfamily